MNSTPVVRSDEGSERTDTWFLSTAPIGQALFHLCVPMVAAVSISAIYGLISTAFIGSLHSTSLLSAVTFGGPVLALILAVASVFGIGGSTAISRRLGSLQGAAADSAPVIRADIRRYAAFTVWGAVATGVVLGAVCLSFLGPITSALGANNAAAGSTASYIGIQFAGAPIIIASFVVEQLVRAQGATRASMVGLIASVLANLIFDALFILILHWGVFGAGLAVVLSNVASLSYFVIFVRRHSSHGVTLSPRWFSLQPSIIKGVFSVGSSGLVMSAFLLVSSLLLNNFAASHGDSVVAAFGVSQRIVGLPVVLCGGIYMGALPLVAYSFGSRNRARLRRSIRGVALAIGAFTIVFSGLVFLLRDPLFRVFSANPDVWRVGVLILSAQLVSTIFNGFTGLMISIFQGTGSGRPATIMSSAQGILFVPVVLIANAAFGLKGLIWAMTVTELLVFITGLVLWSIERPTHELMAPQVAATTTFPESAP